MELVEEESKFIENGVINLLGKEKHENFLNDRQKWQKTLLLEANKVVTFVLVGVFGSVFFISIFHQSLFHDQFDDSVTRNCSNFETHTSDSVQSSIFFLFLLLLCALAFGYLAENLKTPSLLGMLLIGLLIRNLDFLYVYFKIIPEVGTFLRKFAFLIILLRAGLGLDPDALKRLKGACIRLAFIPCSFEALAVAIAAYFFLDLQITFGLLLGFILAAVSPAVVVPGMLEIQAKGLGVEQGIPTLVTAAASIDDVYAITWFTLILSVAKSGSIDLKSLLITAIRAPIEVVGGCFVGVGLGTLLWLFPDKSLKNVHFYRMSILLAISCAFLFGSAVIELDSIGPIIVLVLGFVAAIKWRKDETSKKLPEQSALKLVWDYFAQPLLFSLIGLQLSLAQLNKSVIFFGLLVLCIGIMVRILAAYGAAFGAGFERNERCFIALAWLPKATVQAALAPILLDMVVTNPETYTFHTEANIILTVGVLSILLTAPLGSFLIRITAPLLLKTPSDTIKDENS
uniref:Cation/H+ exchanger domain-containing protein n=1 Tax=Acrobeloides nanus TaxID=290746 RepID=A0A914EMY8_9BILA